MEVSWGRILLVVACLLLGATLLYAGIAGELDMRLVAGGAYFVLIGVGAGLLTMGRLLPGRAGELLSAGFVAKLMFWSVVALLLMLIVVIAVKG